MKFIRWADVHLDTPLQGLAKYSGAPVNEIRNATRRAFEKVLSAAISEKVDFLVIAGDLYDIGLKSFESALFFNRQMVYLHEAGIEVYLVYGNHDAASKLTKQLRPPGNVHVLRTNEPQTIVDDKLGVAIHGQGFATPEITEDLAANYPAPDRDLFNIGVLHTNLSGFADHANYAPCTLEELKNKGYQYWALGHVHNRHAPKPANQAFGRRDTVKNCVFHAPLLTNARRTAFLYFPAKNFCLGKAQPSRTGSRGEQKQHYTFKT